VDHVEVIFDMIMWMMGYNGGLNVIIMGLIGRCGIRINIGYDGIILDNNMGRKIVVSPTPVLKR